MRRAIKEYIEPSSKEKQELWEKAIFVFDTNVLLNLYRYSAKTVFHFGTFSSCHRVLLSIVLPPGAAVITLYAPSCGSSPAVGNNVGRHVGVGGTATGRAIFPFRS